MTVADLQAAPEGPAPPPRVPFLDDWWNPILVKEVRQALRGRFFKISFAVTLVAVTFVGGLMIMVMDSNSSITNGTQFCWAVYFCLSIAVLGLVPFSAFNAMGAEWDENTFDLLIISNLKPRQIVLGKLLSAGVQTLLFYAACTPFIVFSFLLSGVDLLAVAVVLSSSLLLSLGLSVVAIGLSTFSKVRFARVVLMAMLGGILAGAIGFSSGLSSELLRRPSELRDIDALLAMSMFVLVASIIAGFFFVAACNMLAHAEENRSSGLRILTTVSLVASASLLGYFLTQYPERSVLTVISITAVVFLVLTSLSLVTEPEPLGRRVAPRVTKNTPLALLISPWLPGGGRGAVFFLLHLGLIVGLALVGHAIIKNPSQQLFDGGAGSLVFCALYAIIYLLVPTSFASKGLQSLNTRLLMRVFVPLLMLITALLPAVFGFFVGNKSLGRGEHIGNPVHVMSEAWEADKFERLVFHPPGVLIGLVAVLAVAFNLRRITRGFAEVALASERVPATPADVSASDAVSGS